MSDNPSPARMRQVARTGPNGRRISYLDTAAGESVSPGTRALLLLHAFPMNADMWQPQMADVPDGWRFVAPDMRGFGWSEADTLLPGGAEGDGPSIEDYARDMFALLDVLGVEQAAVAGLSMGGYAAFAMLRLAHRRIAGLVLADTKAEADTADGRRGRRDMIAALDEAGLGIVIEQMVPKLLSESGRRGRPDVEQQVRAIGAANSAPGVRQAILRMLARPDSTDLLAAISCPTLVVVGSDDGVTPPAQAVKMQQRISGAALAEIPGAGHLSNLEQPQAFNVALHRFLEGIKT